MAGAAPDDVPGLPAVLQARFAALQAQFRLGLAQRMKAIEQAGTPQELEKILHQLAGAAGAYGYVQTGQLARETEMACREHGDAQWRRARQTMLEHLRGLVPEDSCHRP